MCIHCGLIYLTSGNLANNELVVPLRRGLRETSSIFAQVLWLHQQRLIKNCFRHLLNKKSNTIADVISSKKESTFTGTVTQM